MCPKESVKNDRVAELIKIMVKYVGVRGFARAVGISPAIVTRYTQGKVGEPTTATLDKLADYFKVPVGYLRGEYSHLSYKQMLAVQARIANWNNREELNAAMGIASLPAPGTTYEIKLESMEKYKELITALRKIPTSEWDEAMTTLRAIQDIQLKR
jgi:transcriptional regulator with XRE-family HTH domain